MNTIRHFFNQLFGDLSWKLFLGMLLLAFALNLLMLAFGLDHITRFIVTVAVLVLVLHSWDTGSLQMLVRRIKLRINKWRGQ